MGNEGAIVLPLSSCPPCAHTQHHTSTTTRTGITHPVDHDDSRKMAHHQVYMNARESRFALHVEGHFDSGPRRVLFRFVMPAALLPSSSAGCHVSKREVLHGK